ncbi:MAG: DUF4838 domain-containing protein [Kiritimatiellae bacterium]|nr:DUF4838 domain-containing protein [Kiritimatiellia bacterium]
MLKCRFKRGFMVVLLLGGLAGCAPLAGPSGEGETGVGSTGNVEVVRPDGNSDYEIVTAAQPSASAREGALELQRLIEKTTGARLTIVNEPTTNRLQIVVGAHPLAQAAGLDAAGFEPDAYAIRAVEGRLYLFGMDDDQSDFFVFKPKRISSGSYLAVTEFVRQFLNVEWYMPGPLGEEAPSRKGLAVPSDLRLSGKPFFPDRDVDVVFGASEEENRDLQQWGRRLGLGSSLHVDVQHAWYLWMPPEEPNTWGGAPRTYGAEHPEYFALVNGKRSVRYGSGVKGASAQLCVSNPDVVRVCAENMIAYSKRTGIKELSLSENDGGGHCECEQCRAWDVVKRGDPNARPGLGDWVLTDRVFRFANRVAELVTKEVPDARIGLYAYHNTLSPPREGRLNDAIVVSDVYNNWPYLFYSPPSFNMLEGYMRGWREKCGHVILTTCCFNGYFNWSLPWSTLDAQAWLIRMMAEYPASKGIRIKYSERGDGAPIGVLGPDPWVVSRLLWHPHQSVEELTARFYLGAFGPEAGPLIRRYFETIEASMGQVLGDKFEDRREIETYQREIALLLIPAYSKVRVECRGLIDQAAAAVKDRPERYRWRVDRIARAWRFAELTLDGAAASRDARAANAADRPAAWAKAVRIGQQWQAMLTDPENRFVLASKSAMHAEESIPLGVVSEVPEGEGRVLTVLPLSEPVAVDGLLNEPVWQKAGRSTPFRENMKGGMPQASTHVVGFYNQEGLFLGFACSEPFMRQLVTEDDPMKMWHGDVVEAFLVPPGDMTAYRQFCVNPNGIGKEFYDKDMTWTTEWKHAAGKGTNARTAVLFIPWKSLGVEGISRTGEEWRGDFFRERYTAQTEFSGWSPTGTGFGVSTKFGRIRFAP